MRELNFIEMTCVTFAFCAAAAVASPAQTLTPLASFDVTKGLHPGAALTQGTNGNLYGTAEGGGVNNYGTIFEITPGGTLTNVHNFCSEPNCADGGIPSASLILGANGNFYGTTVSGGTIGLGGVFELSAGGKLKTIYNFSNSGFNSSALIQAVDGNFYGITEAGGASGHGTVFKITPTGNFATLYNFCPQTNCADGSLPSSALVQASNGNLYGSTISGGNYGYGTIFQITPSGTLTTLHSFDFSDGATCCGALVQETNGKLYGTSAGGGANSNFFCGNGCGTAFEISTTGELTTLYNFCGLDSCADGSSPEGLVQATDGNLYGNAGEGGSHESGVIFEIAPTGGFTTLYSFCSERKCADGGDPAAGLTQATDGNFYGTATIGGSHNSGTVFSFAVGLQPFVKTVPGSGTAGAGIIILGNNLTSTTGVSFNGTAAAFTVVSDTEITATVPTGATTGTVQVTTSGGTLDSNVAFRVAP
jgi:uncharacterized repeat protein (TIGR03803 family)